MYSETPSTKYHQELRLIFLKKVKARMMSATLAPEVITCYCITKLFNTIMNNIKKLLCTVHLPAKCS